MWIGFSEGQEIMHGTPGEGPIQLRSGGRDVWDVERLEGVLQGARIRIDAWDNDGEVVGIASIG